MTNPSHINQYRLRLTRSFFLGAIAFMMIGITLPAFASTYVPLDSDIYRILTLLDAEGVITSGLLSTKPLSRNEVRRLYQEAERSDRKADPAVRDLIANLKERIDPAGEGPTFKPVDEITLARISTDAPIESMRYARYLKTRSTLELSQPFHYNNDGKLLQNGTALLTDVSSRIDDLSLVSFFVRGELTESHGDDDFRFRSSYGVLSYGSIDVLVGKDAQWWGPGEHGALLISNNAESLSMVRVMSSSPLELPWIFRYLGKFGFTFFTAEMDKARTDYPSPILWGLRFDLKPIPYLELGFERTAIIGGKGRPVTEATMMRSVTGYRENISAVEAGDQIAGGDIKVTLPFQSQPLQLYAEIAGEDKQAAMPFKRGYVMGLYAPRIVNIDSIDFRVEYATDRVPNEKYLWYMHDIYSDGYTYEGVIMGHHMGTDARDLFLETTYHFPGARHSITLSRDREDHNVYGPIRERRIENQLSGSFSITSRVMLTAEYGRGTIKNPENTIAPPIAFHDAEAMVRIRF